MGIAAVPTKNVDLCNFWEVYTPSLFDTNPPYHLPSMTYLYPNAVDYVYDVTVCVPSGGTAPTLKNILYGRRCYAEMLVRRIPLSDVPTESDEATGQWLQSLYREKVVSAKRKNGYI